MSNAPALPAVPSDSTELVAAEADYEVLTEALMQTRRGRWFLAEHARRCRQMDQAELMAALGRIQQALAEHREPAGLAEVREQLGALPRIEQALAEHREPQGIADLRENLSAVTQAVTDLRAEVIAQRPADAEASDRARARDEEMLRLLQEQRERLDALADIWGRAQPAPAPPAPIEPQAEPARPDAAADLAGAVSGGGAAVAMDVTASAETDVTAGDAADIAAAAPAVDDQLDPSAGADPERYDADIPTSELLDRAALFELGIDSPPAEAPRDEVPPPEPPPAGFSAGTDSLKWVPGGGEEPARLAEIEPACAAASADDTVIEPGAELPATTLEAAPDELRPPEPTQLPAWLVGAAPPESLAVPGLRIAQDRLNDPETLMPEPPADGTTMDCADTVIAPDGAAITASPAPAPQSDAEPVLATEVELVLEFEAEPEGEAALAVPIEPDAEREPETEIKTELKAEPQLDAGPEPEAEPALGTEAELDRDAKPDPEALIGGETESGDDFEPVSGCEPKPDAGYNSETENEFNPENALVELRRILGLDPNSAADWHKIMPLDQADDARGGETLEEALAGDVIEELPVEHSTASKRAAAAPVIRIASDPLDPVRVLSEEERIALFS